MAAERGRQCRFAGVRRQFGAVASATLTEGLQQPAALLLALTGVVATALVPLLQLHRFGEPGRLARDGGLAYQLTIGLLLATGAAGAALHAEITRGTAAAALSKPVPRDLFLLGKFAGVARLTARFWFCLLAATLLAERVPERLDETTGLLLTDTRAQLALLAAPALALAGAAFLHYRRKARFGVAAFNGLGALLALAVAAAAAVDRAGRWAPASGNLDWRIVAASLPLLALLLVYAAVATALATRCRPGVAHALCLLLLGTGLAADHLAAPAMPAVWRGLARLTPNVQHFWLCDALAEGGRIPLRHLAPVVAYALAWCAIALGLGMLAFRRRDIG
jgi:hypothetical protein